MSPPTQPPGLSAAGPGGREAQGEAGGRKLAPHLLIDWFQQLRGAACTPLPSRPPPSGAQPGGSGVSSEERLCLTGFQCLEKEGQPRLIAPSSLLTLISGADNRWCGRGQRRGGGRGQPLHPAPCGAVPCPAPASSSSSSTPGHAAPVRAEGSHSSSFFLGDPPRCSPPPPAFPGAGAVDVSPEPH